MGVADRDWFREPPSEPRRPTRWKLLAVALALALVACLAIRAEHHAAPADPEHVTHHDLSIDYGFGLSVQLERAPLYAAHDPWRSYLADERTCPNAESLDAPLRDQAATMICLIDYARRQLGLVELPVSPLLSTSVRLKGEAIVRCQVFAHAPCGGDPHDVAVQAGYVGSWGENIYIAAGRYGAPRPALDGWLNSPGHRENLFRPEWRAQSVYLVKVKEFPGGFSDATLWVSEFGDS